METALPAIVIIFLVLFAILTLSSALMDMQVNMQAAWQEMDERIQEQARTILTVAGVRTEGGTRVELTLRNTGSVKLADFDHWDVIVQYADDATPSGAHLAWLPRSTTVLGDNEWTIEGIYADAALDAAEVFEPGIFNAGEEAVLVMQLAPAIQSGSYVQAVVATSNGSTMATIFKRNIPPVLAVNAGIRVNLGESVVITDAALQATDADDTSSDLTYNVTVAPGQGTLNAGVSFTQAMIDSGGLEYLHSGTTADSFTFTVSDGEDSIGSYTFDITVNNPPSLDVNAGLTLAAGATGLIGDLMLFASDPDADDTAAELVFTVTTPPVQGSLSMMTFTQQDIIDGLVNYVHTGSGADSFVFSLSDGEKNIGPFTFTITTL